MTIDEMLLELERMRDVVGGDKQVAVVRVGCGENDYIVPAYGIVGKFEDQDRRTFRCALIGDECGEEFTRKGVEHYEWDPEEDDVKKKEI